MRIAVGPEYVQRDGALETMRAAIVVAARAEWDPPLQFELSDQYAAEFEREVVASGSATSTGTEHERYVDLNPEPVPEGCFAVFMGVRCFLHEGESRLVPVHG